MKPTNTPGCMSSQAACQDTKVAVQAISGGAPAYRGIAVVRVRPRAILPRAGSDFIPGESVSDDVGDNSVVVDGVASALPVSAADVDDLTSRVEQSVSFAAEDTTTCERNQATMDSASSTLFSGIDPRPLGSTLISGPLVVARHQVMDSAAPGQDTSAAGISEAQSSPSTGVGVAPSDAMLVHDMQSLPTQNGPATPPATTFDTPAAVAVSAAPVPPSAEPTITPPITPRLAPSPPSEPFQSTVFSPLQVTPISDTFTTGAGPPPGNSRDSFVTGHPSPSSKGDARPYLASGPPTDSSGYPAFRFDDAAATQYSAAAQSIPARPNYEPRYPLSRSSNCDAPPPPMADSLNSSQSIAMAPAPAEGYGYQRMPQDPGPVYGYSRPAGPQQQGPQQRPYQYRLPPTDQGPSGGPLPLAPPGPRGLPPQYGPGPGSHSSDPWDIFEPGSAIGFPQGLLHIDGGVYGGYGPGPGGGSAYAGPPGGYNSPPPGYGYNGAGPGGHPGGYNQPPPPPSYQYGGGGGGAYGQQPQYYAPPPPGQYGGGPPPPPPPPPPPGGGYRGAPPPPAEAGQYYGYPPPAAPRRASPSTDQNYTYKARAPAGNMPEENLSYSYGNSYAGGTGFGSGGNYGGQTSYGSPMPGNYSSAQQEDTSSYPGIELLSPGYPEFEQHARQAAGGRGGSQQAAQELRYPGMDGGTQQQQQQQQRAFSPSGITEYSDRYTPPAYGSSYSGYTAPSAYAVPPPEAYGQYQQPGGYGRAPPPQPGPEAQYGYRGGYPGGYPGAGPAYPGAYPQRPMGMTTPEQERAVPISAARPRAFIADDSGPGAAFC